MIYNRDRVRLPYIIYNIDGVRSTIHTHCLNNSIRATNIVYVFKKYTWHTTYTDLGQLT